MKKLPKSKIQKIPELFGDFYISYINYSDLNRRLKLHIGLQPQRKTTNSQVPIAPCLSAINAASGYPGVGYVP